MRKTLAKPQGFKPPATMLEAVIDSLHSASSHQPGVDEKPAALLWADPVENGDHWYDCRYINVFKQAARERR